VKPLLSPAAAAAISAALTFAVTPAIAQQSTVTERTVTDTTVTTRVPARVETEIDFLPASSANDLNTRMLRDFEIVKEQDPAIATEIARNPSRVGDQAYVMRHPALQAFIAKYPNARDEIQDSPGNFVTPVNGSTWNSHEVAGIPRDESSYAPRYRDSSRTYRSERYANHPDTELAQETTTTVTEKRGNTTTEMEFKPASSAHDLDKAMLRDFGTVKGEDPKIATELAVNPSLIADQIYVKKHPSLQAFLQKYPEAREELQTSPGNFLVPVAGSKWNSHEAAGIPRD
jgi:hypothetical protein